MTDKKRAKTGGRQKGIQNLVTRNAKERVLSIIDIIDERVENDLAKLSPKERLDFYTKLLPYVCPKAIEKEADNTDDLRKKIDSLITVSKLNET